MKSNNLAKTVTSAFLAMLLFWIVTVSADINVNGSPTGTYSGGATATYSGTTQGGSGGGGGGGGTSAENYSNIELKEKYDLYIFKNRTTSYVFTNGSNPIVHVNISGNTNAGEINAAIEVLRDTSSLINIPAPGIVYKNINIWVGTSGFAGPKNIKEAVIRFRVKSSWMTGNNLAPSDVRMVKWEGDRWIQLETMENARDTTYTYYEAKTSSFAGFAISGLRGTVVPTEVKEVMATITEKPAETTMPSSTRKAAGFEVVFALTALAAIASRQFGRKMR